MIKQLQKISNQYFGTNLKVDGINGAKTKKAIYNMKLVIQQTNINDKELYNKLMYYTSNYKKFTKYFDEVYDKIRVFASTYGYDAFSLLSQFALETGYGAGIIEGSYNLGNIKAKHGEPFVEVVTTEYYNNIETTIKDKFRKYEDYYDFLVHYHDLLQNTDRYTKAFKNRDNCYMFFRGLSEGGYATDPNYITKALNTYNILKIFYSAFYKNKEVS